MATVTKDNSLIRNKTIYRSKKSWIEHPDWKPWQEAYSQALSQDTSEGLGWDGDTLETARALRIKQFHVGDTPLHMISPYKLKRIIEDCRTTYQRLLDKNLL